MPTSVPGPQDEPATDVLASCVCSFLEGLTALGYSDVTVRAKRATVTAFARWMSRQRLPVIGVEETTIDRFIDESGRRRDPSRIRRCTLRAFLEHLRAEGKTTRLEPVGDPSYGAQLEKSYERHLRVELGLAEGTIGVYLSCVTDFVRKHFSWIGATPPVSGPGAQEVRTFFLDRARARSPKGAQLAATALRSFLRFLFLHGETPVNLAFAIPTVRHWQQATVHPYLRPDQVECFLDACDRTTAAGRRDHAILLLLARLGLRAGEVAALEIGDVRWRCGEIAVRGKGQRIERVPLLSDVGTALALYLRQDRPASDCRRVFLRDIAPRIGLHPGTIGGIVRHTLLRAGLRPVRRGAHLLRHSLATTMIRRGASMAEIGEVLRHRSPDTTEIYAKVDFEALRAVALPWPGNGGAL